MAIDNPVIGGIHPRVEDAAVWRAVSSSADSAFVDVQLGQAPVDYFEPCVFAPAPRYEIQTEQPSGYVLGRVAVESVGVARMDSLPGEEASRLRYQRFLGGVALYESRADEGLRLAQRSALTVLREAAEGNRESLNALLADARPHAFEIIEGVGGRMESEMDFDEQGNVVWSGQTTEERQMNAITAYPGQSHTVRRATDAEGRTAFRIEDRARDGQLKEGMGVYEWSLVLDDAVESLVGRGYFVHTVSCALRRSRPANGKLRMTSLFLGGVDERLLPKRQPNETEADEQARLQAALENRFDIQVVAEIYQLVLRMKTGGMGPVEFLDTPMVVEGNIDDIDFARLYDTLAARHIHDGAKTFLGSVRLWQEVGSPEVLTREHYETYFAKQQERYERRESLCRAIVAEQVRRHAEAATPAEAVDLKRRVVLEQIVEQATQDKTIDAYRVGAEAAAFIEVARAHYGSGDIATAVQATQLAKNKAKDPSCPPGAKDPLAEVFNQEDEAEGREDRCFEIKDGDRVTCPFCGQTVTAQVPKKGGRVYCGNGACKASLRQKSLQQKADAPKRKELVIGAGSETSPPKTSSLFDKA